MTAATYNELRDALAQAGFRLTDSRKAVLETIAAQPESFSAEQVWGHAKGAGRATVYRTVRLLLNMGMLCKIPLQDGNPRYSVARIGHHHHAVCIQCGTVSDFRQCNLEDLLPRLRAAIEGEMVGHRLEVYFRCRPCLARAVEDLRPRKS